MSNEGIPQPRQAGEGLGRATRDACTVPHFNEFMGELFIEQLLRDDLHAVVPSVGIDFLPVLQNCLDARRRRQSRDIKLLTVALCGSLLSLALIGVGALPLVPFPVVGMLVVAYCVVHKDHLARQRAVLSLAMHRPSDPHRRRAGDWAAARLAVIKQTQKGNLSVYRDLSPFQGFGTTVSTWSLTVRLRPKQQDSSEPIKAFTAKDISQHVKAELAGLCSPQSRAERTTFEDRVFVNGKKIPEEWMYAAGGEGNSSRRPVTTISESELEEILRSPKETVRHYLCVHMSSWEGEVVASTFLHCCVESETLYLDFHQTVLSPVRIHPQARQLLNGHLPRKREAISEAVFLTVPWLVLAPLRALNRWRTDVRLERRRAQARERAAQNPAYDYSSWFSLRELIDRSAYENFFQSMDVDRHCKTAQRNILASVIDFLDARGVDTSEFRKQQTSILNHGVLQLGGTYSVKAQAIGPGAKAVSLDAPDK